MTAYILWSMFAIVFYIFILPIYFIVFLKDTTFDVDFYYLMSAIFLSVLSYIGLAVIVFLLLLHLLSRLLNKYIEFLKDKKYEFDLNNFKDSLRRKNEE